jgi:hypothetical protein
MFLSFVDPGRKQNKAKQQQQNKTTKVTKVKGGGAGKEIRRERR